MAAAVLVAGMATAPAAEWPQDLLAGKSGGLLKCVRGILRDGTVRHVKVKGHHFHCKYLVKGKDGERVIWLTHEQFGRDDNIRFRFRVDPWNKIVTDSLKVEINKGISIHSLKAIFPFEFKGPSNPGRRDYDAYVRSARQIGNGKVKKWESAAGAVATIVIAQIGAGPIARHTAGQRGTAATTMQVGR
jgi:hypothetical protein